jgi:cytochrome c biogenesis protein CcmG/thiol:disulfide interchange protein DsbE
VTSPVDAPTPGAAGSRRPVRTAAVVVGVVAVLLLGLLTFEVVAGDDDGVRSGLVGRAAPAVVGTATNGEVVDIDRWRGDWVLVNFFATWCVPCVREHPELVEFARRHGPEGDGVPVEVVSIAFDDDPAAVEEFFATRGGDWPVLVDDTGPLALDFGVRGVPESFLISPAGQVVALFYGVTADAVDEAIVAATTGAEGVAG